MKLHDCQHHEIVIGNDLELQYILARRIAKHATIGTQALYIAQ